MIVKERRIEATRMKTVLTGMVVSDEVLAAVAAKWPKHGGLFPTKDANEVARWCIEHHEDCGKAPGRAITKRYAEWAEEMDGGRRERPETRNMEQFLRHLSDEYDREPLNAKHVIKQAQGYFDSVLTQRAMEQAELLRADGKVDEARAVLSSIAPFRLNGEASRVVKLSDVERRKVSWLWRSWIPWGQLAIIDGDMGCGKTQIALDLAARVTRGWGMPPGGRKPHRRDCRKPANVLILSSEDDAASTIGPRFDAAGGDPERCWVLTPDPEGNAPMTFPQSYADLLRLIRDNDIRLVVIDPFYGFLDGKVDSNTDHKVRVAMRGLSDIAQATGCAIVLIRHLNKKTDTDPLYRGGGSVGVAAACPAALIIGRDPENRDVRVLAANRIKHAPMAASIAYDIEGFQHTEAGTTSRVSWIGETELTAHDILQPTKRKQGRPSQQDEIVEFIRGLFTKRQKKMPASELEEKTVERFGCSHGTYLTARKTAGVKATKDGMRGGWIVQLSEEYNK